MRIDAITLEELPGKRRVAASVEWEDADRPSLGLFAETDADRREGFWPDPNAFLTACALPAWHAGERRVFIDGELCPVLHDRIAIVFATLQTWYPELGPPPTIEAKRYRAHSPLGRQAASYLSCGIDSLAILQMNRVQYPSQHPSSIKAVLCVDFLQEHNLAKDETAHQAQKRLASARTVASDAGVDAIPVTTNVLELDPDGNFFSFKWHGAALLFIGHLFSQRFHKVSLASTYDAAHLEPWGSHPLLDPYYGSAHLEIEHAGLHLSRLEKTRLVADWPVALDHMLVCQGQRSGDTNCGACEKCIRTMTALVALRRLDDSRAFPSSDVTPALLETVREYEMIYNDSQAAFYGELLQPLRDSGREDLAVVVDSILRSYHSRHRSDCEPTATPAGPVPDAHRFILADDQRYGLDVLPSHGGRYWGQPADAQTAVREIEALRRAGADFMIFRPQTYWWLNYFTALNEHLRLHYTCRSETDQFIVFDLRERR